ncbi:glycine cleavage system aminomethyltransferase GcvT [Corynebacterium imitans]|uniref:glycine cleavage system aminomethyltransferase GcvT n=1 Tax=Corynebacterium imitans TaxID=156978 RepID=UPI00254CD9F1|nr:glycine cleavage system aminomethyltransferase GcvT [Corynebacterium imitans]MDK8305792.1 glycine cleavage system aminomethyltransferase GcvT [Corynebacterium imitans]MDK8636742.1 glycine cleavage system aminomethyltransferase GcvT [Corynebacterium imitans]MDK8772357.1 glycine cleavage system aminomethyltransferase GcvT [Corynebacterium imitans]
MPQTPLHATHEKLGASFTDFGGWEMPLKYGSELEEHRAVRSAVGIFDLSHMGEISVQGLDAAAFLDYALISNFSVLKDGKAKYSMIVAEDGGIIDDLITYRFSENHFLVVPNAANTAAVWAAFEARKGDFNVQLTNNSEAFGLVAVQGPGSLAALQPLLSDDASALSYYSGSWMTLDGTEVFVARTGYTGEDGFELFCTREDAQKVWDAVIDCGTPCGLASRDSLRLEASMPLYGNELSTEITPVEAGMGRAFAKKEADFVGKEALVGRESEVVIAGLTSEQRRAARSGAEIYLPGSEDRIGVVTSGQPSPTLGYPVALAHLAPEHAEVGTDVEIDIRGRRYPFTIVDTPFYSRKDA